MSNDLERVNTHFWHDKKYVLRYEYDKRVAANDIWWNNTSHVSHIYMFAKLSKILFTLTQFISLEFHITAVIVSHRQTRITPFNLSTRPKSNLHIILMCMTTWRTLTKNTIVISTKVISFVFILIFFLVHEIYYQ